MTLLRVCFFLLLSFKVMAQKKTDSIITLPEVEKIWSSKEISFTHPAVDSKFVLTQNLSEVLSENAGTFIKNYGNGQLASISIRGTSAAQTDVMWNGVQINSPGLGQVDFALLNMGMGDRLEFGGISKFGNVGGFVNLSSNADVDSGFLLNGMVSYGSFNTLRVNGNVKYANSKFSGATRVGYFSSKNNYTFTNTYKPGHPTERLKNGKVQLLSLMQQFLYKVNANHKISLDVWLSDAQRQIPPVISQPISNEKQNDYSARALVTWHGTFGSLSTHFTSAILHDVIQYQNPEALLNQKSILEAYRNNFSWSFDGLKKITIEAEAGYDFERAVVPAYTSIKHRHITKIVTGVTYHPMRNLLLRLTMREHVYDRKFSPFSASLFASYKLPVVKHHDILFHSTVSRNFRFPTLNDWYWQPGGNVNLKTEKSVDGEFGMKYSYSSNFRSALQATGFCKYVDNWILWMSTGSYWQPFNVKRVLSTGVEISTVVESTNRLIRHFQFLFSANYTYTHATNLDAISPADQSKGKQLIYVPLHTMNTLAYVAYKKFYLRASNHFTGKVFITTDNSQNLQPYSLLYLEMGKEITINQYSIELAFKVNNVTNTKYQVVAQKPMPGRNFEGILRFKFKR